MLDEPPAVNFTREENRLRHDDFARQEIRPLKALILNLMPKKIETENQFLRLLSNSPRYAVDIQLCQIDARESSETRQPSIWNNFYCNFRRYLRS